MPQGFCKNCNRLIFDTEKVDELRDEMACQHCGMVNIIRVKEEPPEEVPPVVVKPPVKSKKSKR